MGECWVGSNRIKALLAKGTEAGSRTLVHATGAGSGTQYLDGCMLRQAVPLALN